MVHIFGNKFMVTHFRTHGWSLWQPMRSCIWQHVIGPHGMISFVHMVVLVKLTVIYMNFC
jgi:hypothetical protein